MPPVPLTQAINDLEAAQTQLLTATNTQVNAQGKFDGAKAALDQANTDNNTAISNFNSALDEIIAAATAAKIPVPAANAGSNALPAAAGS